MRYITFPEEAFKKFINNLPLKDIEPECSPGEEWDIEWENDHSLKLVKKTYKGSLFTKITYLSSDVTDVLNGMITEKAGDK